MCKDDNHYLAELKQQKSKRLILLRSTLTLWQCAAINLVNCPSSSDRPINLETERVVGCCSHVTTAREVVYIYVSNCGQRRLQPAAREQRYAANYADLQTPMCLVRAVRHFLIIVDELMNETKWIL